MESARGRWATRWLIKPVVFTACLLPALRLIAGVLTLQGVTATPDVSLGADPVAMLLHTCGRWALNFLLITLCVTPLRDVTHTVFWLRFRRMLGLFAFFYAFLHLIVYVVFDRAGKLGELWQDIVKRPFITIGVLALVLLLPLVFTSTAKMQRRLGRRWTRLHSLIYVVAVLGVWHFWWGVKKDIHEPLLYACGLALLLAYRLWKHRESLLLRISAAPSAKSGAS